MLYHSNLFRNDIDKTGVEACKTIGTGVVITNNKKLGKVGCNNQEGNSCKTSFK